MMIRPIDDASFAEMEERIVLLAREHCPEGACPIDPVLRQCVHDTVEDLWGSSRITAFIPVLALRHVLDCIRTGTCASGGREA